MLNYIYDWIENIAFYLVIIVALIQMIPNDSYKKYVRFFAGLILILMLCGPILKFFGASEYQSAEYEMALKEIESKVEKMEEFLGE